MNNMTLEQQVTEAFQKLRSDLIKIVRSSDHPEVKELENQADYIKGFIRRDIIKNREPLQAHHVGYFLYE